MAAIKLKQYIAQNPSGKFTVEEALELYGTLELSLQIAATAEMEAVEASKGNGKTQMTEDEILEAAKQKAEAERIAALGGGGA